jgi:hypothetical protein
MKHHTKSWRMGRPFRRMGGKVFGRAFCALASAIHGEVFLGIVRRRKRQLHSVLQERIILERGKGHQNSAVILQAIWREQNMPKAPSRHS